MTTDTRVFTRDDAVRWAAMLVLMLVDFAWLLCSSHSVAPASLMARAAGIAALAMIATILGAIAAHPRVTDTSRGMHYRRLALLAQSGAYLVFMTSTMSVLSYLLVTTAPPLVDDELAMLDRALGFDWPAVHAWVRERPAINVTMKAAYASGGVQMVLVPMLAALLGRPGYLREFLAMLTLSCILLLLISAPWPAAGAYVLFGGASTAELASVSHFGGLRDGSMLVFELGQMQGLVSMPSYHTTMALIFMQAMRWSRAGFVVAAVINLAMIASTPTEGGHYLVDVIAGIALWGLTAWLLHAYSHRRAPATLGPVRPAQPA